MNQQIDYQSVESPIPARDICIHKGTFKRIINKISNTIDLYEYGRVMGLMGLSWIRPDCSKKCHKHGDILKTSSVFTNVTLKSDTPRYDQS